MAKSIFEKCKFTQRHQQVVNYYMSVLRKNDKYNGNLQFNTFSSESSAKYGKIEEFVAPYSALVKGDAIEIHNETEDGVQVLALNHKKRCSVLKTPLCSLE